MEKYAKKTFLALINPYNTVIRTFPTAIDEVTKNINKFNYCYYLGVKNTKQIPKSLIDLLSNNGFVKHTIDAHSLGGRAIDLKLINPLTGKYMTGSSSGTALNVLYCINDLGVGTDGGGSVLGPAIALNLYGFISKLIVPDEMKMFSKLSTDNIEFSPSIGYIARDLKTIEKAVSCTIALEDSVKDLKIYIDKEVKDEVQLEGEVICIDKLLPRKELFAEVIKYTKKGSILISKEWHVDVLGFGDSVFGLHDKETRKIQNQANKGLIRVVNMLGLTCLAIPTAELSSAIILVCNSDQKSIKAMLNIAKEIRVSQNQLARNYFGNLDNYFQKGYCE